MADQQISQTQPEQDWRYELADFRVYDAIERRHVLPDGTSQPAGTCSHCGTGIAICVQIRHITSGEEREIGTDCALKVGMDRDAIKAANRVLYARKREQARAKYAAEAAMREAEAAGRLGAHGTESRYTAGCRCYKCMPAAPHGTADRFHYGRCRCLECIEAVCAADPKQYRVIDGFEVVYDLATGRRVEAEEIRNDWGKYSWKVTIATGGRVYMASGPKQRKTQASKGFVQAVAPTLVRVHRTLGGPTEWEPICALGEAFVDHWGEPIPHPIPA